MFHLPRCWYKCRFNVRFKANIFSLKGNIVDHFVISFSYFFASLCKFLPKTTCCQFYFCFVAIFASDFSEIS